MAAPDTSPGRRERNKAATRARILAAGLELFAVNPVDAVTTQQLAERADVAEGTLFNYIGSKGQLLLQTTNYFIESRLRKELMDRDAALNAADPVDDHVYALLEPIVDLSFSLPENFAAYYREILFGPPSEDRDAAITVLRELETRIGEILEAHDGVRITNGLDTRQAGRLVWSSMYLEIVGASLRDESDDVRHETLRRHLGAVLHGLIAPV